MQNLGGEEVPRVPERVFAANDERSKLTCRLRNASLIYGA
jgi:hypothetical protein